MLNENMKKIDRISVRVQYHFLTLSQTSTKDAQSSTKKSSYIANVIKTQGFVCFMSSSCTFVITIYAGT